jgi:hypothetical protein
MTARRRLEHSEFTTHATPEACADFIRRTGALHPSSRWCGLVYLASCGATGELCDGACARQSRKRQSAVNPTPKG